MIILCCRYWSERTDCNSGMSGQFAQMRLDHLSKGPDGLEVAPIPGGQHCLIADVKDPALHCQPLHLRRCSSDELTAAGTSGVNLVWSELQLLSLKLR
ncbi:hypothetical protein ACFQY5_38445 [Paeniroseomonas aquatica]|uniref:Uncharacterized protein n=1 Tax=Paeniroseomonas aquatica TaxID=373043 RepID=A0ABT7ZZW9_9PROT|nr:hypothetical protein [Paeniroseomonas aquatica]MDN3563022.1 hypothetical protein [Paeniroseomonas aquatica]